MAWKRQVVRSEHDVAGAGISLEMLLTQSKALPTLLIACDACRDALKEDCKTFRFLASSLASNSMRAGYLGHQAVLGVALFLFKAWWYLCSE